MAAWGCLSRMPLPWPLLLGAPVQRHRGIEPEDVPDSATAILANIVTYSPDQDHAVFSFGKLPTPSLPPVMSRDSHRQCPSLLCAYRSVRRPLVQHGEFSFISFRVSSSLNICEQLFIPYSFAVEQ